jgi:preprotein translocase subunit YajC
MDDSLFLFLALAMVGVLLFYSSRKRKKQAEQLRSEVVKGAYVMLTSGIFGKVANIKEERIELETAPGQKLTVAIGAVARIEPAPKASAKAKPVEKKK